jgi:hypothetical protein
VAQVFGKKLALLGLRAREAGGDGLAGGRRLDAQLGGFDGFGERGFG